MRILLAKNSGFCFGVRRAVEMAEQCAQERGTVYTYGNIIHNDSVVRELAEKGVHSVEDLTSLNAGDTLIIRAHGAPPAVYEECEARGIRLIDATCPYVKRIHKIAQKAVEEGRVVLIAGKANHPEVVGIRGWAGEHAYVLEGEADVDLLPTIEKAALVAQTTLPEETFDAIQHALEKTTERTCGAPNPQHHLRHDARPPKRGGGNFPPQHTHVGAWFQIQREHAKACRNMQKALQKYGKHRLLRQTFA